MSFREALEKVLKHEGGYVDHPEDPGGETNLGVTKKTYTRWCMEQDLHPKDMKDLTVDDVEPIYKRNYWDRMKCDQLPAGVAYFIFDFAVNSGPKRASEYLQATVGCSIDGVIGPITIEKTNEQDALHTIDQLHRERQHFYEKLKTFEHFGKGWTRRNQEAKDSALELCK
jgi:lysozyme family protein